MLYGFASRGAAVGRRAAGVRRVISYHLSLTAPDQLIVPRRTNDSPGSPDVAGEHMFLDLYNTTVIYLQEKLCLNMLLSYIFYETITHLKEFQVKKNNK